jgi:hypothetical protein
LRRFFAYKQTSGDSGANVKRLDVETKEKIAQLQKDAQTKAPDVSSLLLARMCMREALKSASFICGSQAWTSLIHLIEELKQDFFVKSIPSILLAGCQLASQVCDDSEILAALHLALLLSFVAVQ